MASATGTGTVDFGAAPGGCVATATISAADIGATDHVECWIQGDVASADHNAYEHATIIANCVTVTCSAISASTSFTVTAMSSITLSGTVAFHYARKEP